MIRPTHRRIAFALLAAMVAAGIAVPRAALGCDAARHSHCCCQSGDSQYAPSTDCVSRHCPCCQPAAPQNLPPERTIASIHPDFALASHFAVSSNLARAEIVVPAVAPVAYWIAIPHRILHCSWLI